MNDPHGDASQEGESPEENEKPFPSMGELSFALLHEAILAGASEIQIRPVVEPWAESKMRLRWRVQGEFVPGTTELPWFRYRHLISRFKKMAFMDLTKTTEPQSGKMKLKVGGEVYNMTVQIQPIQDYETCVIYLAGKDPIPPG